MSIQKQHDCVRKTISTSGPSKSEPLTASDIGIRGGSHYSITKSGSNRPSRADILFKVEMALARLEAGDYGYCITCHEAIDIDALTADPSVMVCDDCRHSDH
ncbi:MAG: hypothetical protein CMK07_03030 [Ponticaulis sp.]|nr:hypothetical protein [Ponticaulis sp.]